MEILSPKYIGDLIGILDACELLKITRQTLSQYRKKHKIQSIRVRKTVMLSKIEVLQKLYVALNPVPEKIAFTILSKTNLDVLKIDETSFDLRMIDQIDGHGAISLICFLMNQANEQRYFHLLIDESNKFLKSMGFFNALKMYLNKKIFWDENLYDAITVKNFDVIKLPISRLGVVGAHTKLADNLTLSLRSQGHSLDICSYIGWALGELADNSATHAKTHPSFAYFEQSGEDERFLQLTIGDSGVGIPESLKSNIKYKNLKNNEALLTSFRPYVSGRADEEERGKGLTDVLQIAMECNSNLRVESNGIGYFFAFNEGVDNFRSCIPTYKNNGTIISILFIDGQFNSLDRSDVDAYIVKCLEKI